MTLAESRKRVGDRLCLVGNVDITHMLVDATREEVVEEVRGCIRDGAQGGGYIMAATNSSSVLSHRNIRWMVEATEQYGTYPISPDL